MATIKPLYGSSNQALTITIGTLANSAALPTSTGVRQSTAVDNTSALLLDALVQVKATLATGTPANEKAIYVYAFGTADGGSNYTGGAGASDAAYTLRDPSPLRLIGVIPAPDSGALTYTGGPWSVAAAFGGVLPDHWGIVVRNYTGLAFTAATAWYQGVQGQSA